LWKEVVQTDAYQQPVDEEHQAMGIQGRGEEEQTTTDSTESWKKRKKLPGTNNDNKSEYKEETEDMEDKSKCIHLQRRNRQVLVLPNTERFELQKKY
jgi:hypothetical protein